MQPWGRVQVSPQRIHITISLSCFSDTESPTRWEKLTVCCPQALRPQTQLEPEGWWCWLPLTSPPTNQKNVRELITPSLNHYYKTPPTCSRSGHTVLKALAHCGPLCLAKQQSYSFLLHQKFCLQDLIQCWVQRPDSAASSPFTLVAQIFYQYTLYSRQPSVLGSVLFFL